VSGCACVFTCERECEGCTVSPSEDVDPTDALADDEALESRCWKRERDVEERVCGADVKMEENGVGCNVE
jgi:hypothetical protein